jgi:hypothetical protein
MGLRHCHDRHRLLMATTAHGGIDSITDFPKAFGKV